MASASCRARFGSANSNGRPIRSCSRKAFAAPDQHENAPHSRPNLHCSLRGSSSLPRHHENAPHSRTNSHRSDQVSSPIRRTSEAFPRRPPGKAAGWRIRCESGRSRPAPGAQPVCRVGPSSEPRCSPRRLLDLQSRLPLRAQPNTCQITGGSIAERGSDLSLDPCWHVAAHAMRIHYEVSEKPPGKGEQTCRQDTVDESSE